MRLGQCLPRTENGGAWGQGTGAEVGDLGQGRHVREAIRLWTRTKAVDADAGFRLPALLPITSGP